MNEGNLFIRLIAKINRALSKTKIQQDITQLEKTPFYLRLTAALNKNKSRTRVSQDLKDIGNNQTINVRARVDRNSAVSSLNEVRQSLQQNAQGNPVTINAEINAPADSLEAVDEAQEDIIRGSDGIRGVVQSYVNWQRVLELVVQAAKKAIDTVKELSVAQTDLQIATGKSNAEMQYMMKKYNQMAHDLSTTTTDIASSSNEWIRQGKTISETNELIQGSIVLSKVGQLEASEATEYLTSALNGYELEAKDVISVVDKLSAVDLESATNAGELAEAMSKTAVSARLAGVDIDNLIGYLAAMMETSKQSASVTGTAMKSMLARYGKVSIGNFIDSETGEDMTADINQMETILSKYNIELRNTANEFRSFDDVLKDISVIWDDLSNIDKEFISAGLGGSYQKNMSSILLSEYSKAMKLAEVSANSAGKSIEKFTIYENGLEAATNRLTASFESLAYNTIDSEFMGNLANATASIIEFIDKSKLIQTGLTALSFTAVIKGLLLFSTKLIVAKNNINAMTTAMNLSTMTTQRNAEQNTLLGNSFSQLTASQQRLILSNKKLNTEQRIAILMSTGMTREMAEARLQAFGLATAEGTAASATFSLRGAWEALKLSIASNPLGLIITALTTATMLIQHNIQKQEELRQEIKENADQARETSKEIFDLYNQYNDLSEAVLTDASNKEQLTSVTDTLLEKLGYEKSAIKGLTEEYGDLDTAIKSVTLESLKTEWDKLLLDYGETEKELEKLLPMKALANGTRNINIKNDKGLNDYDDTIKLIEDSGIFDEIIKPYVSDGYSNPNITFRLADGYDGAEGAKALYDTVTEVVQLLNSTYSSDELLDNAVYKEFVNLQETLSAKITEFDTSVSGVNTNLAQQEIIISLMNKEIPDTVDEFESYKDTLINSALANDSFVGTEEDIRKAIEGSLATMPEFAKFFEVTADTVNQNTIPSIEDLTTAYKALSEALDEIYGKQDKLTEVFEKIASGAKLTAREVLELVEDFPDIMKYITQDGDGYTITPDNMDMLNGQLEGEFMKQTQGVIDEYQKQKDYLVSQLNQTQNQKVLDPIKIKERDDEVKNLETEISKIDEQIQLYNGIVEDASNIDEHQIVLDGIDVQYNNAKSAVDDYNNSIKSIDSAIDKMNEGQALTYDEMVGLVEINPDLVDSFDEREDGYYIEIDALNNLRDTRIKNKEQLLDDLALEQEALIAATKAEIIAVEISSQSWKDKAETLSQLYAELASMEDLLEKYNALRKGIYDDSSSGSGKDQTVTAFEKELKYLDYLRDMGMISAKEYYKQLYFLNEKYYSDNTDYLEQYRDNEVKIRDGIVDVEIRAIDRQIEALELLKEKREEEKELQELQVELEEKKLELLNKQSQKNVRYYDAEKREWIWTYNREDVADAQKAVDEAQEALDEHLYQSNEDKKIEQLEQIKEILQGDEDNPNNATQFVGSEGVTTQATARKVTAEDFYKYIGISQKVDTTALMRSIYAMGLQPNVQKIAESTHNQNISTVNRNIQGNQFTVNIDGSGLNESELTKAIENGTMDALMKVARQMELMSR